MIVEEQGKVRRRIKMPESRGEARRAQARPAPRHRSGPAVRYDHAHETPATSGQSGWRSAITLNKRPISSSSHSRRRAAAIASVRSGLRAASAAARAPMPERLEPTPLADTAASDDAGLARGRRHRREIDVRGQIALARRLERIGKAMARHRLQRVAALARRIAIIDDQRDAAMLPRDAAPAPPPPRRAPATSRAPRPSPVSTNRRPSCVTRRSSSPTHCRTGSASKNSLATSSNGAPRQLLDAHRESWRRQRAPPAQRAAWRSSRRMPRRPAKPARRKHAQRIGGERSAPRPKLGINRVAGPSGAVPDIGQRGADHLAEHLADLGRGDEVARRPERVARAHNIRHWPRPYTRRAPIGPSAANPRLQPLGERVQATLADPNVGSTRTRRLFAVAIR